MNKSSNDVILYKIIRPIIKWFTIIFFNPKYEGLNNILENERVVLAGNHTSYFDSILLISSTKREIHFLAKVELFKGLKKILFSNLGLIPVDRKRKNKDSLNKAIDYLNNNKVIGIFPEATTEKEQGKMLPFKIGAVKMAKISNSKIVPFKIVGDYKFRSKNLIIKFGKPYSVKTDDYYNETEILKDKIKNLIGDDNDVNF